MASREREPRAAGPLREGLKGTASVVVRNGSSVRAAALHENALKAHIRRASSSSTGWEAGIDGPRAQNDLRRPKITNGESLLCLCGLFDNSLRSRDTKGVCQLVSRSSTNNFASRNQGGRLGEQECELRCAAGCGAANTRLYQLAI